MTGAASLSPFLRTGTGPCLCLIGSLSTYCLPLTVLWVQGQIRYSPSPGGAHSLTKKENEKLDITVFQEHGNLG